MDMLSWKKVLLQWITECGFMNRTYFNIEQSDIDAFYQSFSLQHKKTATNKYKHLGDFLKEFYPSFEINFDDENYLSSADYIYVYSLLLHFCCVKYPETVFHEICQHLPDFAQQCIAEFFKELLETEPITKELLRHAIAGVGSTQITPPRLNDSFSSSVTSVGGLSSASYSRCESPLKTPKRGAGPQRISPSTPKSFLLEERTRELYNLRAQLETERYEKGLLEVQIKQNEDKIQKLNHDHKILLQQIQDLKNDMFVKTSDNSTNRYGEENQIQKRVLKELSQKEQEIIKLSDNVRTLREEKALVGEKLNYAEKKIVLCMNRIKDLDFKVDELSDELEQKNEQIKYLTNSKLELEQFINETRSSSTHPDPNVSVDCLDTSFMRNSNNTNNSNSLSPENLGASVVDVQLREKEHENELLKEELRNVKREHKRLAKHLTKLTQEFDLPIDALSPAASEGSEGDNGEDQPDEDSSADDLISCAEQFNIFNSCMEKIDKFHKTEKNKIKQLEEQSSKLQEENEDLERKLSDLTQEIEELKVKIVAREKLQKELEKSKDELCQDLEKSQKNLLEAKQHKTKLYNRVQSLEHDKETLNKNIEQLKINLESQQHECKEFLANDKKLKDNEQHLQSQLEDLQKEFSFKTVQWEVKLKELSEKMTKQIEDIEIYRQTEQIIKSNYEQIVVQNEELKKEARLADTHLCDIKKELQKKEEQMTSLGNEIENFRQKNQSLEENINSLIDEQKQEKLASANVQRQLYEQLRKLNEQLESKQKECELQEQKLNEIKTKVQQMLKLMVDSHESKDVFESIKEIENHLKNMLKQNQESNDKFLTLQESQTEASTKIDELTQELNQKSLENEELNNKNLNLQESQTEISAKLEEFTQKFQKTSLENEDLSNQVFSLQESHKKAITKIEQLTQEINKKVLETEELNKKVLTLQKIHEEDSTKVQELTQELKEKSQEIKKNQEDVQKLKADNSVSSKVIEELKQHQGKIVEKAKQDLLEKEQELQQRLQEASLEYEASIERIGVELKLEKEHHNNKVMELILSIAEHKEAQKKLNEAENEIQKLNSDNQQLWQSCKRLKEYENRVNECSEENDKLRNEIESFKQQVTQNALRLLEADKALTEFMELTKEQDTAKNEVEILQNKLKEKERTLNNMELKLKQQAIHEEQLEQLKLQLEQQNDLVTSGQELLEKLRKDKERLTKEVEEKSQQILKEQDDKLMLLTSLEKSADQFKMATEEKQQHSSNLQQKLENLKQQFDKLAEKNTKLESDLVEREAELRLCQEEQQQENEDFQQKLNLEAQKLCKKSKQLEAIDMSLIEITVLIENNFNFKQELLQKEVNNVFNYQANKSEENIQKLRNHLNHLLIKQQQLDDKLEQLSKEREVLIISERSLKERNNDLSDNLSQQEKCLKVLKEQLENEELIVEKRITQEVKRLEGDLLNLEKVNDRLANENVKIQVTLDNVEQEFKESRQKIESLEEESLQLKEEVRSKSLLIEKLQQEDKKLKNTLKEKCLQYDKLLEKSKLMEAQLKDKTLKLQNLEKEHQEAKEKAHKNQQKLSHYLQTQQSQQGEIKKLQEKLKLIQTSNESLEMEVGNKNKEFLTIKNKNSDLLQQHKEIEQQLNLTSNKLDEMLTNKINAEAKCEQLQSEVQQLKRDLDFTKAQQQNQQEDINRLNQEIESLKVDKQHLRDEVHENKLSLQRANDNVTQLIQQISSIRLEKEAALEENQLLHKQLENTGKNKSTSETKMKSIIEKSQDFERKLLTAENELKSLKANLEKSESSTDKLLSENKKLRDNQEVSTKRIEKFALKLGDSQARSTKLERDNEKLARTLEAHAATVEALQKEKDLLQAEGKSLKERLSRAERGHEQLAAKVQNLEHLNTTLQQIKQKLEASEIDGKTKLNKLEKMREANEEKIRKLTNSLNNAENATVKLNLEIGALNSQLQDVKIEHTHEQSQQIEELNHKLTEAQQLNHKYKEINEKLKIEFTSLKEENSSLSDQLSKASLSLQITSQKCERFATEMEQIRADMLIMRQEKSQIEMQHETSIQKLNQFESQNTKLVYERKNLVKSLEHRISHLEDELAAKCKEVVELKKEIEISKEHSESHASLIHQKTAANLSELEDLRTKLSLAEDIRLKEQEIISQLRLDNQILHTKYQEAKQRALEAAKSSEERIKENRLELEGKLEKMKNKMDGPHSLDDSMSALLSTTAGGTRKKCTGITHYKRPGPPTPSKNGGRLSFGGSSEPGREILKESYDTNGGSTVASSKTPARFNFLASRFSMGNIKDEQPNIKRESDKLNFQKVIQKTKMKTAAATRIILAGVGCTSTPRKSKVHFDQRRLLDQLMTSSPSPSPLTLDNKIVKTEKKITPPDISFIETPLTALDRREVPKAPAYKSNAKRMEAIAGGLRRNRRNSSMFGRRLSRRMQEICTPSSGNTTSSALSTPAVVVKDKIKKLVVVSSTATASEGMSKSTLLQRRLHRRAKKENGARPSLYLRGNIFAKYRTPKKRVLQDLNRFKSRKQRFEHFNQGRNIKSFKADPQKEEIDKTISDKAVRDITYDLKNNNYATFNHNKLMGETVVVAKCQPKGQEFVEDTFTFGEEQFEHPDTDNLDYMEDYETEEEYDDEETGGEEGDEEVEDEKNVHKDIKCDFPIKNEYCKEELITSQDLKDFDRFIAHAKIVPKKEEHDDDYSSQGSSKHFEKLLVETNSNAPFEVNHIHFNVSKGSRSTRSSNSSHRSSSLSHSHHSSLFSHTTSHNEHDHNMSTASPHLSPNNPTCHLSRTIYGGTVIYSHRLPNINTTYVRKSSIYVKNRRKSTHHNLDSSACNDVVLITNQTITFVDIMRMWSQMDSTTRLIVSFALLASLTTLLGLFVSFCSRR